MIVVNDLSWSFLLAPVGVGALLLALFAFAWHNVVARGPNKGDSLADALVVTPIPLPASAPPPARVKRSPSRSSVKPPAVERRKRRAMPDRYDGRIRQPLLDQPVQRRLRRLVERRRGLVEKQEVRLLQQRAGDAEALLLAERQHPVPVRLLVEPLRQRRQADRADRLRDAARGR